MDTFNWDFISSPVPYTGGVLIAFNVTYNAGGAGISVFLSEDITVANNTCYNNYLDPANGGSSRACIELLNSTNDTVFNNIAVGVPAAHSGCAYSTVPFARFNSAIIGAPPSTSYTPDTFSNNITYLAGAGCQAEDAVFNGDTYSCTANKCATSPGWVSVGTKSTGTETTTPSGVNFALEPGSPAIGYGLTASYLPHSSVDAGACSSSLQVCP
jgi:parallel beta-helix repeat protein